MTVAIRALIGYVIVCFRVSADELACGAPGVSLITFFEKPRSMLMAGASAAVKSK
jgi:hypothetical protein